jgi:hypothetical protein
MTVVPTVRCTHPCSHAPARLRTKPWNAASLSAFNPHGWVSTTIL